MSRLQRLLHIMLNVSIGAAAMLLEEGFSPFDVKNVLISDSTTTVDIGNLPANSHNRILFVESKK